MLAWDSLGICTYFVRKIKRKSQCFKAEFGPFFSRSFAAQQDLSHHFSASPRLRCKRILERIPQYSIKKKRHTPWTWVQVGWMPSCWMAKFLAAFPASGWSFCLMKNTGHATQSSWWWWSSPCEGRCGVMAPVDNESFHVYPARAVNASGPGTRRSLNVPKWATWGWKIPVKPVWQSAHGGAWQLRPLRSVCESWGDPCPWDGQLWHLALPGNEV